LCKGFIPEVEPERGSEEDSAIAAFLNRNLHLKHTVNCDLFALMKQCFEVMKNARNAQG